MESPPRSARGPGGGAAVFRALRYLRRYRLEALGATLALLLVSAAHLAAPPMVQLGASLLMLLGCAALLVTINAALAAVALATILPILALLRVFVGRVSHLFGALQAALGRLNGILQEDLQGIKVVRAFSGEARE